MLAAMVAVVSLFAYCTSTKKTAGNTSPGMANESSVAAVSYEAEVKPIMLTSCAPCHTQGGKKALYDNMETAKLGIDEIIKRVELDPSARGFMPKNKPKLSDKDIATLKKWKDTGLAQ